MVRLRMNASRTGARQGHVQPHEARSMQCGLRHHGRVLGLLRGRGHEQHRADRHGLEDDVDVVGVLGSGGAHVDGEE